MRESAKNLALDTSAVGERRVSVEISGPKIRPLARLKMCNVGHTRKKIAHMLEVSLLGVGSVLCVERGAWSMVQ